MNNIRYKFISLLTEGYNFTTTDEVMSAVKANQVGVKIDQSFKTDQGSIPTKLAFKHFFEKCQNLGIKDPDYRKANMQRKIEQKTQSQKERSGKVLTKQQLEKTVGKDMAHRLTHLDNEKPGTRFPVHVMKSINQAAHRPELYEDYFPY